MNPLGQAWHWAEPWALGLLGLCFPLLLLFILGRKPQRVLVGSLLWWQHAAPTAQARRVLRWPRVERSLLFSLLAVCSLSLAASGPHLRVNDPAQHVAIVLDTSASMQTVQGEHGSRLEQAKAAAQRVLSSLHPDTQVLLLSAGHWVQVLAPFGSEASLLRQKLSDVSAEDTEGVLAPALELAQEQLQRAAGPTRLLVFTDEHVADEDLAAAGSVAAELQVFGEAAENLAITQVEVLHQPGPTEQSASPTSVLVSVKNFGTRPRAATLTLSQRHVQGQLAEQALHLDPEQERSVLLKFDATASDQGAGLVLNLKPSDGQDALSVDDQAYAVVPLHARQPVVLVGQAPNAWIERALRADPGVELLAASQDDLERGLAPQGALLVFYKTCPALLPTSSFVVFAPPAGRCLNVEVEPERTHLQLTHWDEQDLRFRFTSLDGLQVTRATPLLPDSAADALAWSRELPLVVRLRVQDQQGTLVGFDVADSNWPVQTSFVVFVRNLVELARGVAGPAARRLRTGEPLWVAVPPDVEQVRLVLPDGQPLMLRAHNGGALLPAAVRAGFYYFTWQGQRPGSNLLAVSLMSPRESDLGKKPAAAEHSVSSSSNPPANAAGTTGLQSVAWFFALCAVVCVLLEATFATRPLPRPAFARRATKTQAG